MHEAAAFGGEAIPLANPSSRSCHLCPWSPDVSFHPYAIPGLIWAEIPINIVSHRLFRRLFFPAQWQRKDDVFNPLWLQALSQSPREVNSRGCLLTKDPSAKKLQKANWSEAFTEWPTIILPKELVLQKIGAKSRKKNQVGKHLVREIQYFLILHVSSFF